MTDQGPDSGHSRTNVLLWWLIPFRVKVRLLGGRIVPAEERVDRMAAALGEVLDHVSADSPAGRAAIRGLNAANVVEYR